MHVQIYSYFGLRKYNSGKRESYLCFTILVINKTTYMIFF